MSMVRNINLCFHFDSNIDVKINTSFKSKQEYNMHSTLITDISNIWIAIIDSCKEKIWIFYFHNIIAIHDYTGFGIIVYIHWFGLIKISNAFYGCCYIIMGSLYYVFC